MQLGKILEEKLIAIYQTPALAQYVSHKVLEVGIVQWETSLCSCPVLTLLPVPLCYWQLVQKETNLGG